MSLYICVYVFYFGRVCFRFRLLRLILYHAFAFAPCLLSPGFVLELLGGRGITLGFWAGWFGG